jgi:hypothetical protein
MAAHFSDIEKEIDDLCMKLILELRGNQAGNGNALINLELINQLQDKLELYHSQIVNQDFVNKHIVGLLLYTCSSFYVQSKYSNNSADLLMQFEKFYFKLLNIYDTKKNKEP